MNFGEMVKRVLDVAIFGFTGFMCFKMGQNRDPAFMRLRERRGAKLSLFSSSTVYFIIAALAAFMIVTRIADTIIDLSK